MEYNFQNLLKQYIYNPNHPDVNWNLALYYDSIGQTASALSFYLRAAERTDNILLRYECLLRGSMCFARQGARNFTVKGLLQHAISIIPTRPEAYYLLSRFYEKETYDGHWNDSYLIASIGDKVCNLHSPTLRTNVDYPKGNYGVLFQKAVSSWWCGLCDESRKIFEDLILNHPLDESHYIATFNNLKMLNSPLGQYIPFEIYRNYQYGNLKHKFLYSELIMRNYSEAFQDMFILTLLNGKKNGTYLEIGAGHPIYGNNTFLLEKDFNWGGVSIDYNKDIVSHFNDSRINSCVVQDATKIDYSEFIEEYLGKKKEIDYLQLDCDPPSVTYEILTKIPFDKYKFAIITYEHDYYNDDTKSFQFKSTEFLQSHGYVKVINNIAPDNERNYEDWWVHPSLVDSQIIKNIKNTDGTTKNSKTLFLNN